MDFVDKDTRSRIMASVKQHNTGPEIILRKALHSRGIRFRLHDKILPGSPDIILPRFHAVIFVNGCFWHVHKGCKFSMIPKSNRKFWSKKFKNNILRDEKNYNALKKNNWRVLIVWECAINEAESQGIDKLCSLILMWVKSDIKIYEIGSKDILKLLYNKYDQLIYKTRFLKRSYLWLKKIMYIK